MSGLKHVFDTLFIQFNSNILSVKKLPNHLEKL